MFSENRNSRAAIGLLVALALILVSVAPALAQYQLKKPGAATPASITVTYPNGGEVLEKGSRIKITWESTGLQGSMKINLVDASGGTTEVAKRASNRGTYSWTVSSRLDDGKYKIVVMTDDGSVRDESDAVFTIQKKTFGSKTTGGVTSPGPAPTTPATGLKPPTGAPRVGDKPAIGLKPAGGVQGTVGQGDDGDASGASGLTPAGNAGAVGTATSGSTTPSVESSATTVTNELVDRGTVTTVKPSAAVVHQIEAAVFSGQVAQPKANIHGTGITPHISFGSPSAGEEWAPGSQHTIEWESYQIDGNVQIALVRGDERHIILSNTANTGSYTYTVPYDVGLGHNEFRLEAVASGQNVVGHSGFFSVYAPQPIDLACAITNLETKKKNVNGWIFYGRRERWIKFDLTVENNGTAGPIMVPVMWRMIKLPENVVVLQEQAGFGNVYPDAWYITASPMQYKISEYERKYVVSSTDVNFETGYYRLELYADYNNTLNEHEDLRGDNVFSTVVHITSIR